MAKTRKGWLQIPHWYFQCGLTLVQVNTLAEISSWQRPDKDGKIPKGDFYQSMEGLACKYNISYSQMRRVFASLLDLGVIKRKGKMKRMWRYVVVESKLNQLKIDTDCKLQQQEDSVHDEQQSDKYCSPEAQILSTKNNYKPNKPRFNKPRLGEDESLLERSSPTPEEILDLVEDINLDK